MKEYIEREALIARYDAEHVGPPGRARELMVTAPAADVVEVVRCKDCKYWKCYGGQHADDGECWHLGELDCCMHKDDYCSKGKRKMDKEE